MRRRAAHEVLHQVEWNRAVALRAYFADGEVLAYAQYEVYSPADPKIPHQKGRTDRDGWLAFVPDGAGHVAGEGRRRHGSRTRHRGGVAARVGRGGGRRGCRSAGVDGRLRAPASRRPRRHRRRLRRPPGRVPPPGSETMMRAIRVALVSATLALAGPARAHHGVAAVGVAGPEGPGAAIETTSPLPLPQGTLFMMVKTEYVPFQQFAFAEPENKTYSSSTRSRLGYGVRPWLSVYVFQPLQREGAGRRRQERGRRRHEPDALVRASSGTRGSSSCPRRRASTTSWTGTSASAASSTLPVGPTTAKDDAGAYFAPDMQTGFGAPSPSRRPSRS